MYAEWKVDNHNVVVTIKLDDGRVIKLTKKEAMALGKTISDVADSAPAR
jgi:hypothetical protein